MRIAACQYPIEQLASWQAWRTKIADWTNDAASRADILVYPEYASMELTSLLDPRAQAELTAQLDALQALWPDFLDAWQTLAKQHASWIIAPSFPVRNVSTGRFNNLAPVIQPTGETTLVPKLQMTRFEAETWNITGGDTQMVFATPWGSFGVAICYDVEFPLISRRLAVAGAEVIVTPSATDTLAGYHRVRIGCQARALENQCYVVQSPTVGSAPWSIAMDNNEGAAAVYAPPDHRHPATGIVTMGEHNRPSWVVASLDLAGAAATRRDGQVLVRRDWDNPGHLRGPVVKIIGTPQDDANRRD